MRFFIISIVSILTLGLAGCGSFPKNNSELRSHSAIKSESVLIQRSQKAVIASLEDLHKCLGYIQHTLVTGSTMNANFINHYRSHSERDGKRYTFVVEHNSPNNMGNPGWYPRIVADIDALGSKSQLTVYRPMFDSEHADLIKRFATGQQHTCPSLKN